MSAPPLPFPQSLSDKYRPQTIAEFVGLDKPKGYWLSLLCNHTHPHGYSWGHLA